MRVSFYRRAWYSNHMYRGQLVPFPEAHLYRSQAVSMADVLYLKLQTQDVVTVTVFGCYLRWSLWSEGWSVRWTLKVGWFLLHWRDSSSSLLSPDCLSSRDPRKPISTPPQRARPDSIEVHSDWIAQCGCARATPQVCSHRHVSLREMN